MAFIDLYTGTKDVDLGNGYKVVIKKFLTNADFTAAQEALFPTQELVGSDLKSKVNTAKYSQVKVLRAIVSWNIDDGDGNIYPITQATLVDLPQSVFNKILSAVDESNEEPSALEQADFRD